MSSCGSTRWSGGPCSRGPLHTVHDDTVETADGNLAGREIVEHPGAVAIVAIDAEDASCLSASGATPSAGRLDIPAGTLSPGEEPAAAARRELRRRTDTGRRSGSVAAGPAAPGYSGGVLTSSLPASSPPVRRTPTRTST